MLKTWWWKIDHFFERHLILVVLLALVLLLRIPSFFEPYWYGDEAMYLTIGHALNQGKVLYRDIIDHKTPLIYYYAQVGSQINFRLLLTLSMLISTGLFFAICKTITTKNWIAISTTMAFIFLTSLPTFEGLIPNGELFGIVYVLLGVLLIVRSKYLRTDKIITSPIDRAVSWLMRWKSSVKQLPLAERRLAFAAGVAFSLAVLVKAPFIFDFLALLATSGIILISARQQLVTLKTYWLWLVLGFLLPIFLSIIWFALQDALPDYLRFGLLFNFNYAQRWVPTSTIPLVGFFSSLLGKGILLLLTVVSLGAIHKRFHLPSTYLFIATWSMFALIASTLSNRPYPHYVLQFVAPVLLLIALTIDQLKQPHSLSKLVNKILLLTTITIFVITTFFFALFGWWGERYPTLSYYVHWMRLVTGQQTNQEYSSQFNPLINDNFQVEQLIRAANASEIFVWGDNPALYAQSGTSPAGKFAVLFHMTDLQAVDEALFSMIEHRPPIIVVMESAPQPPVALTRFLHNNYKPTATFDSQSVWTLR